MRGRFIVLEGIDGSGKTTQIELLRDWLPTSGLMPDGARLLVTREPGGTLLGRELRRLLLEERGELTPVPRAELLMMKAARAQHVEQVIRPALDRGDWVLSDRFTGSTVAYQGYGRGVSLDLIRQLQDVATGALRPDLVLWLDLPADVALKRLAGSQQDRIDEEGKQFLERVADGYMRQWQDNSSTEKWLWLCANRSQESLQVELRRVLRYEPWIHNEWTFFDSSKGKP